MIDELKEWGVNVIGVVITRYNGQPEAKLFKKKLERRNIKVYTHKFTKGYPTDVDLIVSDEGYGANDYIETEKPLIIVTGPGPGSGKLATSLSQIYHDNRRGINSGYAKFETFPIWNLPVNHPVNIAYEAATADIPDKIKLLPPNIIESVRNLKTEVLNEKTLRLDLIETLIALSISATINPAAQLAMEKLTRLQGCEVHMTHIPTPGDEAGLRRLCVNLTSDPNFSTKDLFVT